MVKTQSKTCRNCGLPLDPDEKCECQNPEVKEEAAKEMLESRKVMQKNGYEMPCLR